MADNTHFDMTAVRTKPALQVAFATSPSGKATHWKHDKDKNRIILAWHEEKDLVPFIAPVNVDQAVDLIEDWIKILDYGGQPDHDGDNSYSFRIYCEDWGMVGGYQYSFAAIEPAWAMYGK